MNETEPPKQSHPMSALALTGWLALALVLYVLSVGPAVRLRAQNKVSNRTILIVYHPLVLLSDKSDLIRESLDYYADLW